MSPSSLLFYIKYSLVYAHIHPYDFFSNIKAGGVTLLLLLLVCGLRGHPVELFQALCGFLYICDLTFIVSKLLRTSFYTWIVWISHEDSVESWGGWDQCFKSEAWFLEFWAVISRAFQPLAIIANGETNSWTPSWNMLACIFILYTDVMKSSLIRTAPTSAYPQNWQHCCWLN